MEPFNITCTTCQAKLKVRSETAIGQILACPKCDSMVQVLPPPGWTPGSVIAASHSAETATADSAVKPASAGSAIGRTSPPSATPTLSQMLDEVANAQLSQPALPVGTVLPPAPPVDLPPLTADWASPTEALWRKVAVYVVAGGGALVLVGSLIGYALSGKPEPAAVPEPAALAENQGTAVAEEPAKVPMETTAPEAKTEAAQAEEVIPTKPPVALPEVKPETGAEVTSAEKGKETPLRTGEPTTDKPASQASVSASKSPLPNSEKVASEKAPAAGTEPAAPATDKPIEVAQLLANDPLENLLPGEAAAPDTGQVVTARAMSDAEIRAAAEAAGNAPAEEPAAPSLEAASPQGQVRRIPAEPTAQLSVVETMEMKLPQIAFSQVPLDLVLAEFSDLTTLPITVDLLALAAANVPPDTLVSIQAKDQSLGEVLTALLATKKLAYRTDARQILVTSQVALEAPRTVKFSVDDLAKDKDQLSELAALVIKLVAPASWQYAGGSGQIEVADNSLSVKQSAPIVYESVVFCEKLRVARGLATRSRLPASRFRMETAQAKAGTHLARPVACTFHAPTRLIEVLRYMEELTGVGIYVDWASVTGAKLGPQDSVTCSLPEQPLAAALDMLLAPLNLDWRVLDDKTIEVFAATDLPQKMTCEFYPIRQLLTAGVKAEVMLKGIHQLTGEAAWNGESGGMLWYDPHSQHLIIRHGRQVHGQVQHLLDELTRKLATAK